MTGIKVAVIPARGGSKRIPQKNMRHFLGKPIIAYSIEAARSSNAFDRIIVSTDDEAIAAVARGAGAETPFLRPQELSGDHTGTQAVVRHALQWLVQHGDPAELACCIYATAPFITARDLRAGHQCLIESSKAYAFSVTRYEFPVQRALHMNVDGSIVPLQPEHTQTRSQDLEPVWHDAAQFYWGRAQAFLDDIPLFSEAAVGVPLPRHQVQDIDTPEDWTHAELMFKVLHHSQEGGSR